MGNIKGLKSFNHITWQEFTQTGVIRRLRSRSGWAVRWQAREVYARFNVHSSAELVRCLLARSAGKHAPL